MEFKVTSQVVEKFKKIKQGCTRFVLEVAQDIDNDTAAGREIGLILHKRLGIQCTESGEYEKAIEEYEDALKIAQEQGNIVEDKEREGEIHELLGDVYQNIQKYEEAKKHYKNVWDIANDEESKGRVGLKLGNVLCVQNETSEAIPYFYEALQIAGSLKDETVADVYEALGNAYYSISYYDSARENYDKNLELAKQLSDKKRIQRAHENLGNVNLALKKWLEAIEYFCISRDVAKDLQDTAALGRCERALGNAYYQVKEYGKAIEALEKGLKDDPMCLKDNPSQITITESYRIIGCAYAKIGKCQRSKEFLYTYLRITKDLGDKLGQAKAKGCIGRICIKTGKFQQAIECHSEALEHIIEESMNETEEYCQAYCDLGCAYLANGQDDLAMYCQKTFLQICKNLKDKLQQSRAHKKIGNIHTAAGNHELAIDAYCACLQIVENTDKSGTVRILDKLGCTCNRVGEHEMAIGFHRKQVDTAENLKDKALAFDRLSTAYTLNGDYSQAFACQEDNLKAAEKLGDIAQEGLANGNIASIHLAKCQYEDAIRFSRKALEIEENQAEEARIHGIMGSANTGLGEFEKAKKCHRKEMKIVEALDDKSGIARANGNMGVAHLGAGEYRQAVSYFGEEMEYATKTRCKMQLVRAYENHGNYYAAIGEYNEAIIHYSEFLKIVEETGDKAGIGQAKGCMGATFTEIGKYEEAVKCHEEELKIAKDLGNRVRESQARGNLGNAYAGCCKYQKAIESQEESLKIADECGVQVDQRRANENLGNTYMANGQYQKALECQRKALKISEELGHKAAEGRIHESMARVYYLSGHIQKAQESSRKSLNIAQDIGDKAGEGRASRTMGNAFMEFGQNMQAAMGLLREHLRISKELSNEADECDAHRSMASLFVEIGQHKRAHDCSQKSLEMALNLRDKAREGRAHGIIGNVYTAIGQYENAIQEHRKHLEIATHLKDRAEIGRANGNLGIVYSKTGKHEKAMECHRIDESYAEKFGNKARVGRAQGNMGNTFAEMKQYQKSFDCHQKRLEIALELHDKPSLAKAYHGLGEAYKNTNHFVKAIPHLHSVLEISTDLHSQELTANAQEMLGQCYQNDNVTKACSFFAKSIINFQCIRDSVRDHDEFNRSMAERFAHVHTLLFQSLLNLNEIKTALLVSDCGKAQALDDLTRKIVDCALPKTFSDFDPMETIAQNPFTENLLNTCLLKAINFLKADTIVFYALGENRELHSWVISHGDVFHKSLEVDEPCVKSFLDKKITRLKQAMDVESEQEKSPQEDVKAKELDITACGKHNLHLKSDIESNRTEIEYLIRLDDKSSPDDPVDSTTMRQPNSSANCNTLDHELHLQDLYSTLIKPIKKHLNGSKLVIIPEGPLFTLPFAALLNPSESHLCEKYSFQFLPSLHVLNSRLSEAVAKLGPALFVGNPKIRQVYVDGNLLMLGELSNAENEVTKCSEYFNVSPLLQEMARKDTVLKKIEDASIIHIAAHGLLNCGVILAPPPPQVLHHRCKISTTAARSPPPSPSRAPPSSPQPPPLASCLLTAEDILKCSLNARLVVLSCCHSGRGKISSEGVVGIARSFLGSGARAVLVALWQIDDHATMKFMDEFYKKLIEEQSVCAAVQHAMIALKKNYPPKDWAAFQVWGEDIVLTRQEIEEIRLASA